MVNRYLEMFLQRDKSNPTQFGVTNALLTSPEMTPTQISERLFRSKHAVSAILKSMQKKGKVSQRVNPKDYRSKYVSLTEKGLKDADAMTERMRTLMNSGVSPLSDDEIDLLNISLRRLRKHLYQCLDGLKKENSIYQQIPK